MCVRCEPAAPAAARARSERSSHGNERACRLHVRCGCLGRRGAGLVTATTRALRGSEIPSPPSAQSETDDGTFQDLRGLHSYRVLETKQKCAALNCIGDSCPAPGKSKVCKSVLPCPRKVESVQKCAALPLPCPRKVECVRESVQCSVRGTSKATWSPCWNRPPMSHEIETPRCLTR